MFEEGRCGDTGKFADCIEFCDIVLKRGTELHAGPKLMARAGHRKGMALIQLQKYEEAVTTLEETRDRLW